MDNRNLMELSMSCGCGEMVRIRTVLMPVWTSEWLRAHLLCQQTITATWFDPSSKTATSP